MVRLLSLNTEHTQMMLGFFVEYPKEKLPILLEIIQEFGQLAGFFINKKKSKLILKNIMVEEQKEITKLIQCEIVQKNKTSGNRSVNKEYRSV